MVLELTDAELAVVKAALTSFVHANLGRADTVMENIVHAGVHISGQPLSDSESDKAKAHLLAASEIMTGVKHGGPGIFSEIVSNKARLAYKVAAMVEGDTLRMGMVDAEGNHQ